MKQFILVLLIFISLTINPQSQPSVDTSTVSTNYVLLDSIYENKLSNNIISYSFIYNEEFITEQLIILRNARFYIWNPYRTGILTVIGKDTVSYDLEEYRKTKPDRWK